MREFKRNFEPKRNENVIFIKTRRAYINKSTERYKYESSKDTEQEKESS